MNEYTYDLGSLIIRAVTNPLHSLFAVARLFTMWSVGIYPLMTRFVAGNGGYN
jgi:hypothetical protein